MGCDQDEKQWRYAVVFYYRVCETMNAGNVGKVDFKIPSNLAPGEYLMRVELVTLHEANDLYSQNPLRGVQLCAFSFNCSYGMCS